MCDHTELVNCHVIYIHCLTTTTGKKETVAMKTQRIIACFVLLLSLVLTACGAPAAPISANAPAAPPSISTYRGLSVTPIQDFPLHIQKGNIVKGYGRVTNIIEETLDGGRVVRWFQVSDGTTITLDDVFVCPECGTWAKTFGAQRNFTIEVAQASIEETALGVPQGTWFQAAEDGGGLFKSPTIFTKDMGIPLSRLIREDGWTKAIAKIMWDSEVLRTRMALLGISHYDFNLGNPLISRETKTFTGIADLELGRYTGTADAAADGLDYAIRQRLEYMKNFDFWKLDMGVNPNGPRAPASYDDFLASAGIDPDVEAVLAEAEKMPSGAKATSPTGEMSKIEVVAGEKMILVQSRTGKLTAMKATQSFGSGADDAIRGMATISPELAFSASMKILIIEGVNYVVLVADMGYEQIQYQRSLLNVIPRRDQESMNHSPTQHGEVFQALLNNDKEATALFRLYEVPLSAQLWDIMKDGSSNGRGACAPIILREDGAPNLGAINDNLKRNLYIGQVCDLATRFDPNQPSDNLVLIWADGTRHPINFDGIRPADHWFMPTDMPDGYTETIKLPPQAVGVNCWAEMSYHSGPNSWSFTPYCSGRP